MERKKKKEGSGFYIAICCCIVIIAIVGYANRMSLEDSTPKQELAERTQTTPAPAYTPKPTPVQTAAPTVKTPPPADAEVSKNVKVEEKVQFNAPVKGKVIEEFSGDDLVYNEALKDWRTHSGVDFAADMGEQVLCCANGIVEEVFDSNMGRCVVVDHKNGFRTMYANLNEDTRVAAGDELAQGDVIGTVGDTALGDSTDVPHLHFEMTMDNKNVNPVEYFD